MSAAMPRIPKIERFKHCKADKCFSLCVFLRALESLMGPLYSSSVLLPINVQLTDHRHVDEHWQSATVECVVDPWDEGPDDKQSDTRVVEPEIKLLIRDGH